MASILPQINLLSGETVDRKRTSAGSYVDGRYVEGTETVTTGIHASVQSPDSKYINIIQQLPEGQRLLNWIQVFCKLDSFRTVDDRNNISADVLVYNGVEYDVLFVTHRRGRRLNHDVVLAVTKEA